MDLFRREEHNADALFNSNNKLSSVRFAAQRSPHVPNAQGMKERKTGNKRLERKNQSMHRYR